ncbi:hypothetical protein ES319_D06G067500v1 [Gossypium barbadense]|uniref:HHO5-like N-terminal domain-containing protein n=1 Tax=Gossypium barbadense TaxID=3634 RepID=A0A5J5R1Z9_GOSBA|nr:hypothetical protein ES319_D06G067500v1 [Gossypium barbadense]
MASSPYELTLDCKPLTSYSMILKSFGDQQMNDQTQKLEHVLSRLEEERLKIDAFKRELPLCMQLLTNAFIPALQPLPDLTFASISRDMEENKCSKAENDNSGKAGNGGLLIEQGKGSSNTIDGQTTISQPHRKARRCWSPDLLATTKQIRELMKVEGLTNDEVKSHLQKAKSKSTTSWTPTSQLVVLGGIWVPSEYATAVANTNSAALTLYGAHHHPAAPHLPPHFCASPVPQEFYTATTIATPALLQRLLHHQLHLGGAGNHSESIEDNKFESGSWKGESGDNGSDRDQRKGLAALTFGEEGEERNGCDITLKF